MPSKYEQGYKYCSKCAAYYQTDRVRCPRCGTLLRSKPKRKSRAKAITPPIEIFEGGPEVNVKVKWNG